MSQHNLKILGQARGELAAVRRQNEALKEDRLHTVITLIPEISLLNRDMVSQSQQLIRLVLNGKSSKEELDELEKTNLATQEKKRQLLAEHGFPRDYLDDIYTCPVCHDSGEVNGKVCSCLEKIYNRLITESLSTLLRTGDESFENFDFDLYDSEPVNGGLSPRQAVSFVYDSCRKFAEKFPDVQSNLLLRGSTGLGKTYLSACIAREVAGRGYSVIYESAASAFEAYERSKFSRDPEIQDKAADKVNAMLDCDLLILDDIGTELITSVSAAAFYSLLNSRLIEGKRMIVSTNLTPDEIRQKYTPQIYSRLIGEFLVLPFYGSDIRLKQQ